MGRPLRRLRSQWLSQRPNMHSRTHGSRVSMRTIAPPLPGSRFATWLAQSKSRLKGIEVCEWGFGMLLDAYCEAGLPPQGTKSPNCGVYRVSEFGPPMVAKRFAYFETSSIRQDCKKNGCQDHDNWNRNNQANSCIDYFHEQFKHGSIAAFFWKFTLPQVLVQRLASPGKQCFGSLLNAFLELVRGQSAIRALFVQRAICHIRICPPHLRISERLCAAAPAHCAVASACIHSSLFHSLQQARNRQPWLFFPLQRRHSRIRLDMS